MKNYRGLFPPVLIVLLVFSMYMASENNKAEEAKYQEHLSAAREYALYGIIVDAEVEYQEALTMRPSADLYIEYMNMYILYEDYFKARTIGEKVIDEYNNNIKVYETLSTAYMLDEDYDGFLELHDRFKDENLESALIDGYYKSIEYNIDYVGGFLDVGVYSGNRCAAMTENGWGFATSKGKKAIEYIYEYVGTFGGGIAPVKTTDGEWFFIDTEGNKKKVLNKIDKIEMIGTVASDTIPVFDGTTWSYYDLEQNLLSGGYYGASAMGNGLAAVQKEAGGKWFIININGELITEEAYQEVIIDEKGIIFRGCYFGKVDGKYYMYNDKGERIIEDGFSDAKLFNDASSYAAVKVNNKWGFIDVNGNMFIEPQYDDARSFSKDLAAVLVDTEWGYIDLNNTLVVDNIYQDAKDFNDAGNAMVLVGDRWQLIKLLKYNY